VRFPVFVVRHESGTLRNDPLINRMLDAPVYLDNYRFLHFGACYDSDFFLMMPDFFLSLGLLVSHC
jgi:hypothetical protein